MSGMTEERLTYLRSFAENAESLPFNMKGAKIVPASHVLELLAELDRARAAEAELRQRVEDGRHLWERINHDRTKAVDRAIEAEAERDAVARERDAALVDGDRLQSAVHELEEMVSDLEGQRNEANIAKQQSAERLAALVGSHLVLPVRAATGDDVWLSCYVCGLPIEGRGVVYEHHVGLPVEYVVRERCDGSTAWHGLHARCWERNVVSGDAAVSAAPVGGARGEEKGE